MQKKKIKKIKLQMPFHSYSCYLKSTDQVNLTDYRVEVKKILPFENEDKELVWDHITSYF